jgi:hypothetical protein|tara:strand:- start:14112 stop:14414 length:303 start_codon:yes stop_codon:yes gene_type:complete
MKKIIDLGVKVSALREAMKFAVTAENGEQYINMRMIELDNKQYSDYCCVVKVPKEDYDKGIKGPLLGFAKYLKPKSQGTPSGNAQPAAPGNVANGEDLPF